MRTRNWTLLAGMLALALVAAACAPATTVPPTSAPATTLAPDASSMPSSPTPTTAPSTVPATATVVASPSSTAAPAVSATPNVPSASATPSAAAIAHLAAGQVITITAIRMIDASTGWAFGGTAGAGDHVLKTVDGGQTWRDVTPPQPAPSPDQTTPSAADGTFVDANHGWVVYGTFNAAAPASVVVWRTNDGGQTWTGSTPIDLTTIGNAEYFQPSDVSFLPDGQTGWFIAHLGAGMNHDYFTIMTTSNGGQTWTRLIDPIGGGPQSCRKTGLVFNDAQNGWLTGDCQGVAPGVFLKHTADGGATWTDVTLPAPASRPTAFTDQSSGCGTYALRFFDAQVAKFSVSCVIQSSNAISTTDFIYSTVDKGQNWSSNPVPARALTTLNPQVIWALPTGEFNTQPPYILSQTKDGGQSWATIKHLAWTGQLDFVDPQTGWAVAQADQAISFLKTADGGKTWQAVNAKIAP